MASWQSRLLVLFLKVQVKRKLKGVTTVQEARAKLAPPNLRVLKDVTLEPGIFGGVAGETARAVGASDAAPTLLYLHGGGYFACSPQTHRPITTGFARRGFTVFAPDYRLAPEHPFPAAIDDAVAAYRGLVASGIPTRTITVAGDSAGGGLVLGLLLSLRDAGEPLPAAAVLFSPWTDLAATGASIQGNAARDALFNADGIGRTSEAYLDGVDPRTPLASPLYAELHGLPPLLIHAGSDEMLLDDSTRLAERAQQAGSAARIRLWPVVPHVWQMFPWLPETKQSMDDAAAFLGRALRKVRALETAPKT